MFNKHNGIGSLIYSAGKGAICGLMLAPSYFAYKGDLMTRFQTIRHLNVTQNNAVKLFKQLGRHCTFLAGAGAAVGFSYTFFFRYLWTHIPLSDKVGYPIGLGVFSSLVGLSLGNLRIFRMFFLGYLLGKITRTCINRSKVLC